MISCPTLQLITNEFLIGPIQAQASYFYRFSGGLHPFPTQRFVAELERIYGVLETRLLNRDYLAGAGRGTYSIADIASWSFVNAAGIAGIELEKFPHVYRWWDRIKERPAVRKGTMVPSGEEFPFGYKQVQQMAKQDPQGTEKREAPLREALQKAKDEFGYEYKFY
jgi:glutathione S-transferase